MSADNKSLGRFDLVGIPPAPRGIPQIEVTFDIDANGIVNVSAKDLGTGKEQKITVTGGSGLNKDEIEKMVKESEKHKEEDKKKKEKIEIENNAENIIYSTEKLLKEYKEKIEKETKEKLEKELEELKELIKGEDTEKIKEKLEQLQKDTQEIGTKMYQKVAEEQAKKQGEEKSKEEPVDAEVVDEEKKE
jgi:molecular chaperone DnaK